MFDFCFLLFFVLSFIEFGVQGPGLGVVCGLFLWLRLWGLGCRAESGKRLGVGVQRLRRHHPHGGAGQARDEHKNQE